MKQLALLGLALALFLLHAACFWSWIVDDAGISLAYARTLGLGEGLRSQPGALAVEGFSNPLWTLLLVVPSFLEGDLRALTLKVLSALLVAVSFALVALARAGPGRPHTMTALALFPIAFSPSFAIWTTSGLENPLFVLLGVASVLSVEKAVAGRVSRSASIGAGLLAGALALTRPDGLAFAPAFAVGLALRGARTGEWDARSAGRHLAAFGALFGGYVAFRWCYFGDFVPNTYHAKFVSSLSDHDPQRLLELVDAVAGPLGPALLAGMVAALLFSPPVWRKLLSPRPASLCLHLVIASAVYLILPPDWMAEFRFATLFIVTFWWLAFELAQSVGQALLPIPRQAPALALGMLALGTVVPGLDRSRAFAENPTVPLARITGFGQAYEALAEKIPDPSLLTPDLGGVLLTAHRLRVHDLAGLCDREVARTLMRDSRGFHDYVFGRLRPTFIHVHGAWAEAAALHDDARFDRDYVALHEVWSRPDAKSLSMDEGQPEPWSGDYVRRSAVATPSALASLRSEFRRLGLTATLP